MITLEQIKEWREIEALATKGEWDHDDGEIYSKKPYVEGKPRIPTIVLDEVYLVSADAHLIAHARNTYPQLLDEIERLHKVIADQLCENDEIGCEYTYVNVLREENKRLRAALEEISKDCEEFPYPPYTAPTRGSQIARKALEKECP